VHIVLRKNRQFHIFDLYLGFGLAKFGFNESAAKLQSLAKIVINS